MRRKQAGIQAVRHLRLSMRTTSPCLMLPLRTASSNASGMDAALVLPYSARLLMTRSCKRHKHPYDALIGAAGGNVRGDSTDWWQGVCCCRA